MDEGGSIQLKTSIIDPQALHDTSNTLEARKISRMEGGVMIEITDDGPGIPHEFMLKLFDPFFTSKPAGEGTGLGLSITKTIIDLHDGHIEIANTGTRGARVSISLCTRGPKTTKSLPKADPIATITQRHKLRPRPQKP